MRGIPVSLVGVLRNWYGKLMVKVRWGSCYSEFVTVLNGVRQGSVSSPSLFNLFINVFIVHLRQQRIGCCIKSMFLGCLLYADDMILLCPSVHGLQQMLDECVLIGEILSLSFNPKKSFCMGVGKLAHIASDEMLLGHVKL